MSAPREPDPPTPAPAPLEPQFEPQAFAETKDLPWTGLTLVVAVLGLLLFMAVPIGDPSPQELFQAQREHQAHIAQESLRSAMEDYHNDHGVWPGARPEVARTLGPPVHDARWLERQLQMYTDSTGWTQPVPSAEFPFGPYLPQGLPVNPMNGFHSVRILREGEDFDEVVDAIYGWVYDPRSGEVRPHVLPFQRYQNRKSIQTRQGGPRNAGLGK